MPPEPQPSIGDLLSRAVTDAKRLATAQVALTKTELNQTTGTLAAGSAFGVAALGLVSLGTVFLLFTLVYVLVQLGLPVWASFLIITILLFVGAAAFLFGAKRKFSSIKGPTLAKAEFEKTKQAFSGRPDDGATAS
jgi:uncharacterized membrane protein YqjE